MFLAPVLVLVGLYIISSLKVLFSSVSPWNIVPQNVVPQNTLSAFIWKGALAFEYNIIMIAIQAYTVLGLLHQRLIFSFLGFCTLTEFIWKKKSVCTSYKQNGTSLSGSFKSLSPLAPEKCFFSFYIL